MKRLRLNNLVRAAKPTECASIDEVFRVVETGEADYGVAPVENSTEGAIGRTLDLLMSTSLRICGEIELPVHHQLMSHHAELNEIEVVYSHAQSLSQCHEWLNKHLPKARREAVVSNAEAARLAKASQNGGAAIASLRASSLFDLNILASNIEDDPKNTTRFLVLSKHDVAASGKDKTSLFLATKNVPGAVMSMLAPLAQFGVSMTKLESRPSKIGLWEYVFFIDIEGHSQTAHVAQALAELESRASILKVLGSYPSAII